MDVSVSKCDNVKSMCLLSVDAGEFKKGRKTGKLRRTNELISENILSDSIETPIEISKFNKQVDNSFYPHIDDFKENETNVINMKKCSETAKNPKKPLSNLKLLKCKIEGKRIASASSKKMKKPKLCGVKNGKGVRITKNGWKVKSFSETSDDTEQEDAVNSNKTWKSSFARNSNDLKNVRANFTPANVSSPLSYPSQDNEIEFRKSRKITRSLEKLPLLEDGKCLSQLELGSGSSQVQRKSRLSRSTKSVSSDINATKSMSTDLDDSIYKNESWLLDLPPRDIDNPPPQQMLNNDATFNVSKKSSNCLNLTWTENVPVAVNSTFRISNTKLTDNQQSQNFPEKRKRSTLTLDVERVNDIQLLKSACNSDGKSSNCLNLTWTENVPVAGNSTFRISNTKLTDNRQSQNFPEKRKRSTLTLDDSVNDIQLLKSACNSDGTPKKLRNLVKSRYSCGDILKAKMKGSINKLRSKSFHGNMLTNKKDNQNLNVTLESVKKRYSNLTNTLSFNQTYEDAELENNLETNENKEASYISLSSGTEEILLSDSEDSSDVETVTQFPRKSALKSNSKFHDKKQTVTFYDESCIVINDSDDSLCATPASKFLSKDRSICEVTSTTSNNTEQKSSSQYLRRSRISSDSSLVIKMSKRENRTSFNLSSPNNYTSIGNQNKLAIPKRTKMPNFAKMHQKLFNNMLDIKEHSEKKAQRALQLLSGQKSIATLSKQGSTAAKKKLEYIKEIPKTSSPLVLHKNNKMSMGTKNVKSGLSRFGYQGLNKKEIISKEQKAAVANKVKPQKSTVEEIKNQIKGVRSNRRFELLMQLRKKNF